MSRTPTTSAIAIAIIIAALAAGADAGPPPKPPRPAWPVDNPTLLQRGFSPSTNNRQLSGIFGPRLSWGRGEYDHHEGFDFFAYFDERYPDGQHPVRCVLPGVVSDIIDPPNPEATETGRKVVVTHEASWSLYGAPAEWGQVKTGYLHLSRIGVKVGQRLAAGDVIGDAGATGYTSTVHLHFNVYRRGANRDVNVNPARLFRPEIYPTAASTIDKRTIEVEWLERDVAEGTLVARVLLPYNCYTLDGFVVHVGKDTSRAISFEHVSAERREARDTGDRDLVKGLRLFPLRYNGGGAIDRVNASNIPGGWPLGKHRVEGGKGVRLGFDVMATGLPADAKSFKLTVFGVDGKKVTARCPGFREVVGE